MFEYLGNLATQICVYIIITVLASSIDNHYAKQRIRNNSSNQATSTTQRPQLEKKDVATQTNFTKTDYEAIINCGKQLQEEVDYLHKYIRLNRIEKIYENQQQQQYNNVPQNSEPDDVRSPEISVDKKD